MQGWLGDRRLVDKTPSYAIQRETLERAEAYFDRPIYIHLLRHPYGMIRSFEEARLEQLWIPRLMGQGDGRAPECPYERRELAEMIWLVLHQNIVAFLEKVPPERICRVRFEDLVSNPRREVTALCSRLGARFDPAMLDPRGQPEARMTDGLHTESRMIGDMKFHRHAAIDETVGEQWKKAYEVDFLGDETWAMATRFGFEETIARASGRVEFEL